MRTGQSRHKPLWLNYAQRLWGPTGRRHSWNRNEGHGLVKPPLIVYCEWLSSAPLLLLVWAGHAHCWNPCVGRVSPVVEITSCLGLLTFACGCFQPDDILHMFERSWVVCMCERSLFFPPRCLLCSGVPFGCSLPDQIDQLLHAILTVTDKLKSDFPDMFHKARLFEWLQNWTRLHKMWH